MEENREWVYAKPKYTGYKFCPDDFIISFLCKIKDLVFSVILCNYWSYCRLVYDLIPPHLSLKYNDMFQKIQSFAFSCTCMLNTWNVTTNCMFGFLRASGTVFIAIDVATGQEVRTEYQSWYSFGYAVELIGENL